MKKVRIHGRGGQGNVTAAELLAAAAFRNGKFSQAFPFFGSERMGAPVAAFVKIDDCRIRSHGSIPDADIIIIQDPTLLGKVDVFGGLHDDGIAIINTERDLEEYGKMTRARLVAVPASRLAVENTGRNVPNVTLLGAFAALSDLITPETLKEAVLERFPARIAEGNIAAAKIAYEMMKGASA